MNDGKVKSMFEGSLRVTSAPRTTTSHRSKSAGRVSSRVNRMNGVFEIPITTDRSEAAQTGRRKSAKTPRPAWSQVQPKVSATTSKKSPKPKMGGDTADFSKTKVVKQYSPRISISQSFHIKNPDLIESIATATQKHETVSQTGTSSSSLYKHQNEFERRDQAAIILQRWWRRCHLALRQKRRRREKEKSREKKKKTPREKRKEEITHKRTKSAPVKTEGQVKVRTPRNYDDIATARARLVGQIKAESSTKVEKKVHTARQYDPDLDESIKFSARIQSSRRNKDYSARSVNSPRSMSTGSPPNEKENDVGGYQPSLYKETHDKSNLNSLLSALNELEKPSETKMKPKTQTQNSLTDLKLAELEASLREIEQTKKVKFKEKQLDGLEAKGVETTKMMNAIFDEKSIQNEQLESQVNILHGALKQQKEEHERYLKEVEKRSTEERKSIVANNTSQHNRQLGFIDQLIKDKQSLAEQLTALAKKLETIEKDRHKDSREVRDRHTVELNQLRDKLTSAEKVRREKWVEAKQKEIKQLTVKGLEPEIARLIARHKQELRNIKAEHEAHLLAADERAARRWADQTERARQEHEEEKAKLTEQERERARERIAKEMTQIEADNAVMRDRLHQERAVEKERQLQHIEYLKESNQTQIDALTNRYNEQIKSLNIDWQSKVDDVIEKTALDIKIEREKADQQTQKAKLALERDNIARLAQLESQLRDQVKQERDAEIERAVDRIEAEVENVRTQSDHASQSRVRRIQEKMQAEIDLAEGNERDALKKYTEQKGKANHLAEELIASKHTSNLIAHDLNEKEQRLDKLMQERERVSDVIREEFADRIVKAERDLERTRADKAEAEARHRNEYNDLKRSREEELAALNERVQRAVKQRDVEIQRITEAAEQSSRRADYMEEMLDKQNKLLRAKGGTKPSSNKV